jgi:pimeloyl-ACP methyl ester carboxylesterase
MRLAGRFVFAAVLAGCGRSGNSSSPAGASDGSASPVVQVDVDAECPVIVSDTPCDTTQRPIVFVHGTYDSGGEIANIAMLFTSNGFCASRFIAIDYNSLLVVTGGPATAASAPLDVAIDAVLQATGAAQVDLMGHSQGAAQCYSYLADPTHAAKVAHYVQLAGGPQSAPPGPEDAGVPTLSISSNSDTIEGPVGVTGAQQTVLLESEDHIRVATSVNSFIAIWQYLHQGADGTPDGQFPQYTSIQCGDPTITLSGLSETIGDNSPPAAGETLEAFEVGDSLLDGGAPLQTFAQTADSGSAFSLQAKRMQPYVFTGLAPDGGVIGRLYFNSFRRSNFWLRALQPSQDPLAVIATSAATSLNDNREATYLVRTTGGSFRQDLGESLTVNGFEALNSTDATRQTATAALWMFDGNKDGKSEGGGITSVNILPFFIRGTDVFVSSSPPAWVQVNYNGTVFQVPNWPSVSEGITEITFVE